MKTPLAVTAATNVVHLALSLALIFPPHLGPASLWGVGGGAEAWGSLGLTGAAVSTSIAGEGGVKYGAKYEVKYGVSMGLSMGLSMVTGILGFGPS